MSVVLEDGLEAGDSPPLSPCPACGSTVADAIEVMRVHEQHLAYMQGDARAAHRLDQAFGHAMTAYDMHRCRRCLLEFSNPPLAPAQAWYAELYGRLHLYPTDRWEYAAVRDSFSPRDTVIDYGCGSGQFLLSVRDRVRDALGFDFSRAAVESAAKQGLRAHVLDLDVRNRGTPLPVPATHVTAFHVLEHLARPEALFHFAKSVAGPLARLWVAVPSDRRASRMYAEPDALDAPPHHLTRWTEASLREIGRRHGWVLEQHLYEPLAASTAVWEATRRLPIYHWFNVRWRPLEWGARRALAAFVWASRRHRRAAASGFSMLACYRVSETR